MGVFVEGFAGGGVDNSKFATAKASNIEKGYTAEVMGALVTGTLETGAAFISAILSAFGCTKYKVETVTPTSNTTQLTHTLGTAPKAALIFGNFSTVPSEQNIVKRLYLFKMTSNNSSWAVSTNYYTQSKEYWGWKEGTSASYNIVMTSNKVGDAMNFKAGVKYTIITFA